MRMTSLAMCDRAAGATPDFGESGDTFSRVVYLQRAKPSRARRLRKDSRAAGGAL